jgi:hypothetical protein
VLRDDRYSEHGGSDHERLPGDQRPRRCETSFLAQLETPAGRSRSQALQRRLMLDIRVQVQVSLLRIGTTKPVRRSRANTVDASALFASALTTFFSPS